MQRRKGCNGSESAPDNRGLLTRRERTNDITVLKRFASIGAALVIAGSAVLSAQMPDLRQMSGQPLPSGDLPAGTISVRVVRQTIANNVSGAVVELAPAAEGAAALRTATTDASGRAVFSDAPVGASLRAVTTVDGERLESQPFEIPASGGLRILLAAGLNAGAATGAPAAPASPAAPGSITLGGQSRIILELAEGSLEVFCQLDVLNPSGGPATLPSPIVFEAPPEATNATLLEGSSPLAKVEGSRAIVSGPLPPGATSLQFAYRMPTPSGAVQIRQALPVPAPQLVVIARKLDGLAVTLAGERQRREVPIEGRTYFVLGAGALGAGEVVDIGVTGLPAHPAWPRYVTLALAAIVVMVGVWAIASGASPDERDEARLAADRAARFNELVTLERRLAKKATPEPALLERRARLVDEIAELDLAIAPPTRNGEAPRPAGSSDAVRAARAPAAQ